MPQRQKRVSRLELFHAAVAACLMVGGSLLLDRAGTLITAEVAGKRERIVVGYEPSGEWDRYAAHHGGARRIASPGPQRHDGRPGAQPPRLDASRDE